MLFCFRRQVRLQIDVGRHRRHKLGSVEVYRPGKVEILSPNIFGELSGTLEFPQLPVL